MKKFINTLVAVVFIAGFVSCASVNKKQKECNNDCAQKKDKCITAAKTDKKKKAACEKDAKACGDECAKIK